MGSTIWVPQVGILGLNGIQQTNALSIRIEFNTPEDAEAAFESFLVGSKGHLSPSEIAKIRDTVGVVGMGGT